ncbi:hypothetical protein [Mucilaginibacter myungsuensis]|uniref:Uncharacterized protein n=1 Tax=Mucilaginibacter myungsuensis TaxID=649104 RepID=A0A929L1B4_9SPHI|nr:hypothetical protein [Mucilaginibacter myungsuensis]MBE9664318.1 hypothetical protein [Mucilaginibacter myungsuensis]MDN3597027.1 hypothetical protein [Mucilaginibacter myungsuensis]
MRFLKVILPPLIAFAVFAILIKYDPFHFSLDGLGDIGNGYSSGLINYYKIFAPFQFVVALLTQYLIILPIWDAILRKHLIAFTVFACMMVVCLLAASGLSYIIWDPATGNDRLVKITLFMAAVQAIYWAINFLSLAILDWKTLQSSQKLKVESQKSEAENERSE